jgi:hypothetical protein
MLFNVVDREIASREPSDVETGSCYCVRISSSVEWSTKRWWVEDGCGRAYCGGSDANPIGIPRLGVETTDTEDYSLILHLVFVSVDPPGKASYWGSTENIYSNLP